MGKLRHLALAAAASAAIVVGLGSAAYASVTIITFGQTSTSNTVTATENGAHTATTITATNVLTDITQIVTGGAPINNVYFDLSATSVSAAVHVGTNVYQEYDGTFSITSGPGNTGTNYLSGAFTDALFGKGKSLSITVSNPPDSLTLTSSVIPAADLGVPSGLSFAFTNVSPPVSIVGTSVSSFTASVSGNASASAIPEPTTWAMMALGFAFLGYAGFQRSARPAISIA